MRTAFLPALLWASIGIGASAQPVISPRQATITHLEGKVYLDGHAVQPSNTEHLNITESFIMRSEDGRAEVLLSPSVTVRLGENGSFRTIHNGPGDIRIEVLTGPVVVLTGEVAKDDKITVVCEDAVTLSSLGAYRFDNRHYEDIGQNFCGFKVYKGTAEVQLQSLKILLDRGRVMDLNRGCGDHIQVNKFEMDELLTRCGRRPE
jgi:hypothetical protein